jgi:hypothetical protein
VAQIVGTNSVYLFKFTFNEYTRDSLKPIFTTTINVSDLSSNLHHLDFFYAMYHKGNQKIYLMLKEMHSTVMSIRSIDVDTNYVDFINMNWVSFVDGTKKKLYFTNCTTYDDDIVCSARSTKKQFVIKFYYEIEWKVEIVYRMNPHFTLNNIRTYPTSYLPHRYFAIVIQTLNVVERMSYLSKHKKWPLINIYKIDKEKKKGLIYACLFWEDFKNRLDPDVKFFIIKNVLFLKESADKIKFIVVVYASLKDAEVPTLLRVIEFEISTYRLRYNLNSLRFRDSVGLTAFDYDSNSETVQVPILIKKNQKIFMYMILNICLVLILTILVIVITYFYAQNKERMGDVLASETHSVESYEDGDEDESSNRDTSFHFSEGGDESEIKEEKVSVGDQIMESPKKMRVESVLENNS